MRLNVAVVVSVLSTFSVVQAVPRPWLQDSMITANAGHHRGCNPKNTRVRKEWGDLSKPERKAYTTAVRCLQTKPTRLDPVLYNTTSLYDDFVAVHINYTRVIHRDGLFLPWHRGYVQVYEDMLVNECGYKGAQPYWDWIKHSADLLASPLFDGSEFSLGGNGADLTPEELEKIPPCHLGNVSCPQGTGGGCVNSVFQDYKIRYLPSDPNEMRNPDGAIPKTSFHVQERCFSRMLNQYIATNWQNKESYEEVMSQDTVEAFQASLDNTSGNGRPGLHPFGHLALGPIGANIFSSPGDPVFFLHHATVDKMWTEWQEKDKHARTFGPDSVWGTETGYNIPPSPNATLRSVLRYGALLPEMPIASVQLVGVNGLCYRYE